MDDSPPEANFCQTTVLMGLANWFKHGLTSRVEALEEARGSLDQEDSGAADSVRRIAHALRGSAAAHGFIGIARAADNVENATEEHLPAATDRLIQEVQAAASAEGEQTVGILVAANDPKAAETLRERLADSNRRVYVAETAREAEQVLAEESIALIILDLILPDRDGRNLLGQLKGSAATASIPVIVLSVRTGPQPRRECFTLGADGYFEKPFDPDIVAAAVAARLENLAALIDESRRDALTKLPNRAAFQDAFERLAAISDRGGRPLTIGMLDLDHFKAVNDTYGHPAGDRVLVRFAEVLKGRLRNSDVVARWGGEEFAVLLPDTSLLKGVKALQNTLDLMQKHTFEVENGVQFTVSFSGGVARVRPGTDMEEAVAAADRALYQAKAAGREQVIPEGHAPPQPDTRSTVLIAEDNELTAKLLVTSLEQEGFEVLHFPDGQHALENMPPSGLSLFLLDVQMPRLNGFELLGRIRHMPAYVHTPAVMLTALGDDENIVRAFEIGADDYIQKPFSVRQVCARVRRLIRRYPAARG